MGQVCRCLLFCCAFFMVASVSALAAAVTFVPQNYITVADGVTLTIEPGAILCNSAGTVTLEDCETSQSHTNSVVIFPAAQSVTLSNNTIRDSSENGIVVPDNGCPVIESNTITRSGSFALRVSGAPIFSPVRGNIFSENGRRVSLSSCRIEGSQHGIVSEGFPISAVKCEFADSSIFDIFLKNNAIASVLEDNLYQKGAQIEGNLTQDAVVIGEYQLSGAVHVAGGSSLTVAGNIKGGALGINITGALISSGVSLPSLTILEGGRRRLKSATL
ncbi:MAG: right-handed parallel beta-helix repeat-containing protein [Clostridia bacterium]|nr:right-handed parallel beta-helix repeat-containing protein [Clostridia bacterium]